MRVHRRQFFLGPAPLLVDESWTSVALEDGFHFSYQQALRVAEIRDREGVVWRLLGTALQSDPERAAPLEEIGAAPTDEVEDLTATWSGRWALLGRGVLRPDACLFSCYYARDPESGRLLASSSPALLQQYVGAAPASPPLAYQVGMEWYPPPASRFDGIGRLLPSQNLAYADREQFIRPRRLVRQPFAGTYDEALAYLEKSLRKVLREVADVRTDVVLSLTGGYDTRTLLAATWREGLGWPTFTWDIPSMSRADRYLPPLLARDAGLTHRMIGRRRFDDEPLRMFDEHTALHTADLDRELVPWGQYDELPANGTIVMGNVFTVGALYFWRKLPADPDSIVGSIEHAYDFERHHPRSAAHHKGVRDWAEWIEAHPEPGMDWRDRFFWEQWEGGWCAATEQGTDFVDVEFVSPVNCEAVMAAILSIAPSKREAKRWQVDLTYRMAPFLTDHPYTLGGSLVNRFRREVAAFRDHPSRRGFVPGRARSLFARAVSPPP